MCVVQRPEIAGLRQTTTTKQLPVKGYSIPMNAAQKKEVIATLLQAGKPELANAASLIVASQRLDSSLRGKVNKGFIAKKLDGNGRFRSLSHGLGIIAEVLGEHGLQQGEVFTADHFREPSGQKTFDLEFINPDDSFSPTPVSNSMIAVQWHTHDNGQFEFVVYLS